MIDWQHHQAERRLSLHLSSGAAWLLGGLLVLWLLGGLGLLRQNQRLKTEISAVQEDLSEVQSREQDLEDAVVSQHHRLQTDAQDIDELQNVGGQLAQIEIQLDGIDFLANRLRESLGLPPGSGTWDPAAVATPQGGRDGGANAEASRLALVQRRILAGTAELLKLQAAMERRGQRVAARRAAAANLDPRIYGLPGNWPARGSVTSGYGWRSFRGRPNFHSGVDVALPLGTGVQATGAGLVLGSGWQPSYGWCVLIQHADGYSTLYAHLQQTLAQNGQIVKQGDWVGLSGSSGNSTGPHLHYELWKDGATIDPRPSMDGAGAR